MNEKLRRSEPLSIAEVNALPAVIDLQTACLLMGIHPVTGSRMAARGAFPVHAARVGKNYRVSTLAVLRHLDYPVAS